MKYLLMFIFIGLAFSVIGQEVFLKILGKESYVDSALSNGIILTFNENPNKCDPIIGFVSLENQIIHFEETIRAKGIKGTLAPIENLLFSEYRKQSYRIEEADNDLFEELFTICNFRDVTIDKVYFKFPEHSYEGEDLKAISAFKNARWKAEIIAKHLNYKITKILNIDDETTGANSYYELIGSDSERIESLKGIMERLNSRFSWKIESSIPKRNGAYNLWVTFVLTPK